MTLRVECEWNGCLYSIEMSRMVMRDILSLRKGLKTAKRRITTCRGLADEDYVPTIGFSPTSGVKLYIEDPFYGFSTEWAHAAPVVTPDMEEVDLSFLVLQAAAEGVCVRIYDIDADQGCPDSQTSRILPRKIPWHVLVEAYNR